MPERAELIGAGEARGGRAGMASGRGGEEAGKAAGYRLLGGGRGGGGGGGRRAGVEVEVGGAVGDLAGVVGR